MFDCGETTLFKPVDDDVVLMHGQVWRVREKGVVKIEDLTDPDGSELGVSNWRNAYVGAYGRATFADDAMGGELSVVQVRCLVYCVDGAYNATRDILRTSSGLLVEEDGVITLTTKRTRYVFSRVDGDVAAAVDAAIDAL